MPVNHVKEFLKSCHTDLVILCPRASNGGHQYSRGWKFQLLEYRWLLEALEEGSKITTPVWMDFKNSSAWLTGKEKLIFDYNNFFGCGYFLTCFSDLMDQKRARTNKFVKIKKQFFHACQLRKGIFEILLYQCCIFRTFFQNF